MLNYIYCDCDNIDSLLYSASVPESFFIFICYYHLYFLTNIFYSNVYLYIGVGLLFTKASSCWLQPSLSIPVPTVGTLSSMICTINVLEMLLQCSNGGNKEEIFLLTFSYFPVINFLFFTRTNVKPHQTQNENLPPNKQKEWNVRKQHD